MMKNALLRLLGPIGAGLAIVAALVYYFTRTERGNSALADLASAIKAKSGDGDYGSADKLLSAQGWRYTWGGCPPSWEAAEALAAQEKGVVDCSGFGCLALLHLGLWPAAWGTFRHIPSAQLADLCEPVKLGEQRPGDLAYYPGHIMVVLSRPGEDGHSQVIGAVGKGEETHGEDPNQCVKVFPTGKYRSDFVTYMRPKSA